MSKVIVYGEGDNADRLQKFLSQQNIKVDCFAKANDGAAYRLIYNLIEIVEEWDIIALAVADTEKSRKIKLELTNIFLDRITVLEYDSLIKDISQSINNLCADNCYCIMCNSMFSKFQAGGNPESKNLPLFKNHHMIGAGYRNTVFCPVCEGFDRERWTFYVLSKYTNIFTSKCRVLHFAPEPKLSERIAANPKCDYYSGDIVPGIAMHVTDVLDIQYKDDVFDYVIINHVMEHIIDVKQAMSEIRRVLKPDGKLIISFPICSDSPTFEDESVTNDIEKRIKFYGQSDHVRLYGNDYQYQIEKFGWRVKVYTPKNILDDTAIKRYGFIPDDVSMICD